MSVRQRAINSWRRRRFLNYSLIISVAALVIIAAVLLFPNPNASAPKPSQQVATTTRPNPKVKTKPITKPKAPLVDLQPTLDNWLQTQSASYSIEIYDLSNKKVVASYSPNSAFFTASLYKPFVVYFGYQKMTSGEWTDTPNYQAGRSRLECLYLAIQKSDSSCAEKLMAELGRPWMDKQLPAMGIKCTSLEALTTCAHDMNRLIIDFINTKDITSSYKQKYFQSMDKQIFRQAFEKGFSKAKYIGSKVGFNLDKNYHETSLVTFGGGRQYIITVMSQGQGSPRPLRQLANQIQTVLIKPRYATKQPLPIKFH